MGVVIFFYHYSRYLNNSIYEEFAEELLEEIFEEIHDQLPIDLENGYLGIGWGIEYLVNQKFIKENSNDVLGEFDKKIMERDIRRILDLSLNTGLEGILNYILIRLINSSDKILCFDRLYFTDLQNKIKIIYNNFQKGDYISTLINNYLNFMNKKKIEYTPLIFLKKIYSSVKT